MSTNRRRAALGAILAVVALTIGWLLLRGDPPGELSGGAPGRRVESSPARPADRTRAVPVPAVAPTLQPAPDASPRRELRLLDVATSAPLRGVTLQVTSTAEGSASEETATTDTGAFSAARGEVRISCRSPSVRLLFPQQTYGDDARDVYACRTARIPCDIEIVGGAPEPRPRVTVLATPTNREAGEWISDPNRVGSGEWLRRNAPGVSVVRTTSAEPTVDFEIPVFPEVTFVAALEGYLSDPVAVALGADGAPGARVRLTLRKARHIAIQVADEEGNPIVGATFQYAIVRKGAAGAVNPSVEFLLRESKGTAFTAISSTKRGTSQVNQIVDARTDANGFAAVDEPATGTSEYIVVWAEGFHPHIATSATASATDDAIEIRLQRFTPACESYRLVRKGTVLRGAAIVLAEKLEDGFTPSLPTIAADADGRIRSGLIVPMRRYYVTVLDSAAGRQYRGDITFGSSADVDVDALTE